MPCEVISFLLIRADRDALGLSLGEFFFFKPPLSILPFFFFFGKAFIVMICCNGLPL